jgi:CubicO group peptidase (beta-lactamase class C family)
MIAGTTAPRLAAVREAFARNFERCGDIGAACAVQSDGADTVLRLPTRFGTGFMLPPTLSAAAGPRSFGHPGAGGSLALADPDAELSFAYAMNQMALNIAGDPRAHSLLEAVYRSLAA